MTCKYTSVEDSDDVRLQEAEANRLAHAECLELLFQDEINVRVQRVLARRYKTADFRESRSLKNFDFSSTLLRL